MINMVMMMNMNKTIKLPTIGFDDYFINDDNQYIITPLTLLNLICIYKNLFGIMIQLKQELPINISSNQIHLDFYYHRIIYVYSILYNNLIIDKNFLLPKRYVIMDYIILNKKHSQK
jgi:hypothetical protein